MSGFPFLPPSIDEPELVHVAFRRAKLAWDTERQAVLMASAGGSSASTGKYLQEALAFAENATHDAITLYIIAIREAHPAVRETAIA